MAKELPLTDGVLQGLARIMGDTADGLKGSEIGRYLQMAQMVDCTPGITKWQRLFNAFAKYQNTTCCCNAILIFCKNYFEPTRFINFNKNLFEQQRVDANRLLAFAGYEISPKGGIIKTTKITTISEAEERANSLKHELKARNTHSEIFRFCYPELLADDYFHAVEEALKGLFERVREISCVYEKDGADLIDFVLSSKSPKMLINNFQTDSEVSEHKGFGAMLKALYSLFRNPEAHSPRVKWPMDKTEALDIFGIISLCHRKLDKAYRISL